MIKDRHISQLIVAIAVCATVGAETGPLADPALAAPPTVQTGAASGIGQTSATVSATVNPNGEEVTECSFEYGTASTPYEKKEPCIQQPGSGTGPVAVTAVLHGLSPNTTYHFTIAAVSGGGRSEGTDFPFETLAAAPPTVQTEAASGIGQASATLNATVNPNGEEVKECWFEYGTSIPYEAKMPCVQHPGSGTGPVAVTAVLQGLSANAKYHFRIVAVSGGGTSEGADSQFMTLAAPPAVPSEPASGTGYTAAAASPPAAANPAPPVETLVRAPLLAHISTHVLKGRILELRFHLSVKARVRLLAKRERRVVARTRWRTLAAGDCKLLLRLNVQRWPKRLVLQTRALGPLPLITSKERVALG